MQNRKQFVKRERELTVVDTESRKKPRLESAPDPQPLPGPLPLPVADVTFPSFDEFPIPVFDELAPRAPDFSQMPLLHRLQEYLAQDNKSLLDLLPSPIPWRCDPLRGYCHGITLTWLRKMREHKANWFYSVKEAIVTKSLSELNKMEEDVLKFLALIQYAQYSRAYEDGVSFSDIDLVLDAPMVGIREGNATEAELIQFLEKYNEDKNMIVISSRSAQYSHTVGIFAAAGVFCYFDANFESGRPKYFADVELLVKEIQHSLYTNFKLPVPEKMDLYLNVANEPESQSRLVEARAEKPMRERDQWGRFFEQEKRVQEELKKFSYSPGR
jgi:hypothetical protein